MAIEKMTRVFVVGPSDRREDATRFMQGLGLVHVEPAVPLAGESEKKTSAALLRLRKIHQTCQEISRFCGRPGAAPVGVPEDALVEHAEERLAALQEVVSRKQVVQRLIADLKPWGNFDNNRIRALEAQGIFVQRFSMEKRHWEVFAPPEDVLLEVIAVRRDALFFTVSVGGPVTIPHANALPLPPSSLAEAETELAELQKKEASIAAELAGIAEKGASLDARYRESLNEASYTEKLETLHAEPYLFGIQGWIPADREEDFLKAVSASGLPLRVDVREPGPDEEPPVLLKNNWFVRRIEPLLGLYGSPKYRDLDPSYFFAPFMVFFFGFCLGDAGYGLFMFLLSRWADKKYGARVEGLSRVLKLCEAFAVAAIFVGLVTGSVFGYDFVNRSWILLDVSVGPGNPMLLFYLALGLGVIHLSLSYILGAMQARTRQEVLFKIGLLAVLLGGVSLVSRSIWFSAPGTAAHAFFYYGGIVLLSLGLLLILLFASDHRNWFVRLGLGLWSIYGLTGLMGDLLSYARLFGLGIATGAIAAVMNQLAGMVHSAAGPYLGGVLAVLVILIGHAFNFALALLGSTVHSARLHFVEAFKSFFEGGGVPYRPFRIEKG
ncbi:MAG: V-type ATP synthase subunit I [Syntrophaceae bacterium PtaU1.Bin231]|nr:MAG: V-type ATP synthase subunit I [Syntrophaceae bacterium PtaU1.Bin231]HOG18581.1 hypothetical protein [Syntrophales bacterium]